MSSIVILGRFSFDLKTSTKNSLRAMGEKLTCLVSSGFLLVSIENWLFISSILFGQSNRTARSFYLGDLIREKRIDLAGLLIYRRI